MRYSCRHSKSSAVTRNIYSVWQARQYGEKQQGCTEFVCSKLPYKNCWNSLLTQQSNVTEAVRDKAVKKLNHFFILLCVQVILQQITLRTDESNGQYITKPSTLVVVSIATHDTSPSFVSTTYKLVLQKQNWFCPALGRKTFRYECHSISWTALLDHVLLYPYFSHISPFQNKPPAWMLPGRHVCAHQQRHFPCCYSNIC
jgi:hypothetical protein